MTDFIPRNVLGTAPVHVSRRAALAGIAASIWACPSLARAEAPFSLGLTPVLMTNDLDLLAALRSYLTSALGTPVEIVMRRTYQEITALAVAGRVNAAWICGYPFVVHRQVLDLVAVPVWRGGPFYRAYLITGVERDMGDWRDLRGQIHAFSDPDSNSGYLMTAALLAQQGMVPADFFSSSFFTNGHRNVVRAVASGLADSGSVDGYVWEVMAQSEPDLTALTQIVRKSEPIGFPPIVSARGQNDLGQTAALRAALTNMAEDGEGRAVLDLLRLDGFQEGDGNLYDGIADNIALLRGTDK